MTKDQKNVVGSDRSRFALSKTRVALRAVVITIAFGIAAILGGELTWLAVKSFLPASAVSKSWLVLYITHAGQCLTALIIIGVVTKGDFLNAVSSGRQGRPMCQRWCGVPRSVW